LNIWPALKVLSGIAHLDFIIVGLALRRMNFFSLEKKVHAGALSVLGVIKKLNLVNLNVRIKLSILLEKKLLSSVFLEKNTFFKSTILNNDFFLHNTDISNTLGITFLFKKLCKESLQLGTNVLW
jgi:hypothetical protein